MTIVKEYVDASGATPFGDWFDKVDATVAAKVAKAREKLVRGHFGNVKSLGEGISEYKIDFGPGYRVYFGQDGQELILLLAGGSKKTQNKDIVKAKQLWNEYKSRKKAEKKKGKTNDGTDKGLQREN